MSSLLVIQVKWREKRRALRSTWPNVGAGGPGLDPCLVWVQRQQKAAAKDARFGGHFTHIKAPQV
jgi:hypothetical protein